MSIRLRLPVSPAVSLESRLEFRLHRKHNNISQVQDTNRMRKMSKSELPNAPGGQGVLGLRRRHWAHDALAPKGWIAGSLLEATVNFAA